MSRQYFLTFLASFGTFVSLSPHLFKHLAYFVRWRIQLMEESIKLLDFETIDQFVQIHDYDGVSMFSRDANQKAAAKEATSIFGTHYPEFLVRLVIWICHCHSRINIRNLVGPQILHQRPCVYGLDVLGLQGNHSWQDLRQVQYDWNW